MTALTELTVGARETVYTAAERIALDLDVWPDGALTAIKDGANYVFYGPDGRGGVPSPIGRVARTTGTLADPGGSVAFDQISIGGSGWSHVSNGTVYKHSSGLLLTTYHAEKDQDGENFWTNLGLAKSEDDGATWTDLGLIATPNIPYNASGTNTIDMGGGARLAVNGNYFQIWFKDQMADGSYVYIATARALISEVIAAAGSGTVSAWKKYHNGGWTEDGIGGESSPLEPGNPNTGWISVAWNTAASKWFLVGTDLSIVGDSNLYFLESPDGLQWSWRRIIDSEAGGTPYPSLIGTGDDPSILGSTFYVYYVYSSDGIFNWSTMDLARRDITVN